METEPSDFTVAAVICANVSDAALLAQDIAIAEAVEGAVGEAATEGGAVGLASDGEALGDAAACVLAVLDALTVQDALAVADAATAEVPAVPLQAVASSTSPAAAPHVTIRIPSIRNSPHISKRK